MNNKKYLITRNLNNLMERICDFALTEYLMVHHYKSIVGNKYLYLSFVTDSYDIEIVYGFGSNIKYNLHKKYTSVISRGAIKSYYVKTDNIDYNLKIFKKIMEHVDI